MIEPPVSPSSPVKVETQRASDGYPIQVTVWPVLEPTRLRGRLVVLHGVQSHGGLVSTTRPDPGRRRLRDALSRPSRLRGEPAGPRPCSLGSPTRGRYRRVDRDPSRAGSRGPAGCGRDQLGGKIAILAAAAYPKQVDALALICPGLQPRVDVSRRERLQIAWAYFTNRRKTFPIPLSDPELFTASPAGQRFIAADRLGLHAGTAGLLAASHFIDLRLRLRPGQGPTAGPPHAGRSRPDRG